MLGCKEDAIMSFDMLLQNNIQVAKKAAQIYPLRIAELEQQFPFEEWSNRLSGLNDTVTVPAGHFMVGMTEQQGDELLRLGAAVPAYESLRAGKPMMDRLYEEKFTDSFVIDKYLVTNLQFHAFIRETGHHPFSAWILYYEHPLQPATGLSGVDVEQYCKWAKRRLPTEDEWERAARGTDGRIWPWGNEPDARNCNCQESKVGSKTAVDQYHSCSSEGCYDMAGNVWEMTSTQMFDGYPGTIMKGGAHSTLLGNCRASFRIPPDSSTQWDRVGLRCVLL